MSMSASDFAAILTALTAFISAVASTIAMIRIQIVKKATNSIVTTMLIEGKNAAHAEGKAAGLAEAREEARLSPPNNVIPMQGKDSP